MKLISWSLVVMTVMIIGSSCASVGEVGEEVIEKITTNPMDPDGVLEDPLWPKKEAEPAETPTQQLESSNNLDEVIGNGLISILVWRHETTWPARLIANAAGPIGPAAFY